LSYDIVEKDPDTALKAEDEPRKPWPGQGTPRATEL